MEVVVNRLVDYSDEAAEQLGLLRADLREGRPVAPADPELLREIIASDYHDQYVAVMHNRIVGAATMSLTLGALAGGRKSWLEDFVVSSAEEIRGKGVGYKLFWEGVISWSRQRHARELAFHSNALRVEAHKFYKRQGCEISGTSPFVLPIEY